MRDAEEGDLVGALEVLTRDPDALSTEGVDVDVEERAAAARARPWIAGPTVVGTGVTQKRVNGMPDRAVLSVVVYVTEKLPTSALEASQRVPGTVQLPGGLDVVTDVVPIGSLAPQVNTGRVRPLVGGYSLGAVNDGPGTGTLGCFVTRPDDPDALLILSNSHVLARSGLAPADTEVVQPGHYDGGGTDSVVATLDRAVPFDFSPGYGNYCDAAVARIPADQEVSLLIPGIGVPTYDPSVQVGVGMQVQKTGRTTGHTVGEIRDVHFRTTMSYPRPGGGKGPLGFAEQVLCSRYTDGGDSGALVCDMQGRAVGLHWCGSSAASVFSPLAFVLEALGVGLARQAVRPVATEIVLLALDQHGPALGGLEGAQGVGVFDGSLVVYVSDLQEPAVHRIPRSVSVTDGSGRSVRVPVRVEAIGILGPE